MEHVMETLDNESFYSKASAGKCVQAFGPLPRAEHHVRLERTSPCQDGSGESPAAAGVAEAHPQIRSAGSGRGREGGREGRRKEKRKEGREEGRKGGREGERESWRAEEGSGTVLILGSGVLAATDFGGSRGRNPHPVASARFSFRCPPRVLESLCQDPGVN